jgi:hypothetical protein
MVGRAPAGSRRLTAQELAAATPATRNRYADLLRVASIFVVVLGHWTMAVLSYHDGKFTGQNLLEIDPWTHILNWIFQVMPIFFIGQGTVVNVVLRYVIVGPIQPLVVEDLLKPAPDDRLVLFGGHGMSPLDSGCAVRGPFRSSAHANQLEGLLSAV